jgi:Tripartite tricarboxylate transporter TctB family
LSTDKKVSAQADFIAAWIWIGFGVAVMIAAWRMDRLESQGASPYTAPGLVPGVLGTVMMLLGLLLALRAARAGGYRLRWIHRAELQQARPVIARVAAFLVLSLAYAAGLVGHGGIPFWLATFVFVTVSVLAFDWTRRRQAAEVGKGVLWALAIGAGTALLVSYVFQEVFLVRLP